MDSANKSGEETISKPSHVSDNSEESMEKSAASALQLSAISGARTPWRVFRDQHRQNMGISNESASEQNMSPGELGTIRGPVLQSTPITAAEFRHVASPIRVEYAAPDMSKVRSDGNSPPLSDNEEEKCKDLFGSRNTSVMITVTENVALPFGNNEIYEIVEAGGNMTIGPRVGSPTVLQLNGANYNPDSNEIREILSLPSSTSPMGVTPRGPQIDENGQLILQVGLQAIVQPQEIIDWSSENESMSIPSPMIIEDKAESEDDTKLSNSEASFKNQTEESHDNSKTVSRSPDTVKERETANSQPVDKGKSPANENTRQLRSNTNSSASSGKAEKKIATVKPQSRSPETNSETKQFWVQRENGQILISMAINWTVKSR